MKRALQRDLSNVWGNLSNVSGNLGHVWGDLRGVSGNLSNVWGNLSGVSGNLSNCEITPAERANGIDIGDLIAPKAGR